MPTPDQQEAVEYLEREVRRYMPDGLVGYTITLPWEIAHTLLRLIETTEESSHEYHTRDS